MSIRKILLTACAAATLAGSAMAAAVWVPPGNDPGGYLLQPGP